MEKTLILGGVRSGKSKLAERLAIESKLEVVYIATATACHDLEMKARISHHHERRPSHWRVVEEPLFLAKALYDHAAPDRFILVDCLTLWLTNLLLSNESALFEIERAAFCLALTQIQGKVAMVSNETGMGVVPMGELSRRYCDEIGWLHQEIASICDNVVLTIAGLPQPLKGKI